MKIEACRICGWKMLAMNAICCFSCNEKWNSLFISFGIGFAVEVGRAQWIYQQRMLENAKRHTNKWKRTTDKGISTDKWQREMETSEKFTAEGNLQSRFPITFAWFSNICACAAGTRTHTHTSGHSRACREAKKSLHTVNFPKWFEVRFYFSAHNQKVDLIENWAVSISPSPRRLDESGRIGGFYSFSSDKLSMRRQQQ